MILITSTGELLLYFTVRTVFSVVLLPYFYWRIECSVGLNCDQMKEGEHYSEYSVESNPRAYMTMRDYRNLAWKNQQPLGRNPNPPRSMRDYRDQWMSAPSYIVPPQYTSTPQPPQPPQLISPIEQAILELAKLVGDVVVEQKKFNAQLSKKIHAMDNPLEQNYMGFKVKWVSNLTACNVQFQSLPSSLIKKGKRIQRKCA